MKAILLVNFGGPRTVGEVEPFLRSLLTDQDVIQTRMPKWLHFLLFSRIAKKRATFVVHDYQKIGGGSPIYSDTEAIAKTLEKALFLPVITFHRYLPKTHADTLQKLKKGNWDEITILPLFPQFTYATTGSIARFFKSHLPNKIVSKMHFIKSYPDHLSFIESHRLNIIEFLKKHALNREEVVLLFSAHGLPKKYVEEGDPYQMECQASFYALTKLFPEAHCILSFQSKFGKGEWLRPYTNEICENILRFSEGRKAVVIIPISFTSDHIETLFEIEELYLPPIRKQGLLAYRVPSLNLSEGWIQTIVDIIESQKLTYDVEQLIRR